MISLIYSSCVLFFSVIKSKSSPVYQRYISAVTHDIFQCPSTQVNCTTDGYNDTDDNKVRK